MVFLKVCHLILDLYGINFIFKDLFEVYNSLLNKTLSLNSNDELEDVPIDNDYSDVSNVSIIDGKLGSDTYFLYDRFAQMQVTINGQLMTMTLVEELELNGGTRRFQNSAMTPYHFNDGYYALPYTHSYLMTFYRTDMFEEYGWKVPETWTDVIQLIPELQIMNFQFYLPLNTAGASSVVNQIFASHLYQNVGDIYQAFYRNSINEFGEEYIESNFDSEEAQEASEFWCNLFPVYSFPLAASFVNRFRSGETPIGIVGYDMYNTLAVSAPEIRGKWDFALLPGTEEKDENGNIVIDHQGAASGMSMIMMGTTDNPYESWAFMDWFTSADTQVSYAREIEAILGAAARHNTANVAAFTRLAWTEKEKEVNSSLSSRSI